MLDSIYHMTLRLLWNLISAVKNVIILSFFTQLCYERHKVSRKSINYSQAKFHSQTRRHIMGGFQTNAAFYIFWHYWVALD